MLDKGRTEAFSDGVIAIAITLLVLDLAVPARASLHGGSLWSALGHGWPSYVAYVVSFLTIGIMWVNHHALFAAVRQVDRWILFANLLLLMGVVLLPFTTSLLAEYLTAPGTDAHVAAALYAGNNVAVAMAFVGLFLAVNRTPGLTVGNLRTARALVRFGLGLVVYLLMLALAFVSAPVTLGLAGAVGVYYCFDQVAMDPVAGQEANGPG